MPGRESKEQGYSALDEGRQGEERERETYKEEGGRQRHQEKERERENHKGKTEIDFPVRGRERKSKGLRQKNCRSPVRREKRQNERRLSEEEWGRA
jgi:hypothetical protein